MLYDPAMPLLLYMQEKYIANDVHRMCILLSMRTKKLKTTQISIHNKMSKQAKGSMLTHKGLLLYNNIDKLYSYSVTCMNLTNMMLSLRGQSQKNSHFYSI